MDDEYWKLYKMFRESGLPPEDAVIRAHERMRTMVEEHKNPT